MGAYDRWALCIWREISNHCRQVSSMGWVKKLDTSPCQVSPTLHAIWQIWVKIIITIELNPLGGREELIMRKLSTEFPRALMKKVFTLISRCGDGYWSGIFIKVLRSRYPWALPVGNDFLRIYTRGYSKTGKAAKRTCAKNIGVSILDR